MQQIEILFFLTYSIENRITLRNISELAVNLNLDDGSGFGGISIRVLTTPEHLLAALEQRFQNSGSALCIVVSDQLISPGQDNRGFELSHMARRISDTVKKFGSSCGMLALTADHIDAVQDIDGQVAMDEALVESLRAAVKTIALRLWYKNPPTKRTRAKALKPPAIEIAPIANQQELRKCFELRGRVYEALGYIEKSSEQGIIEFDRYDRISWHFVAVDRAASGKVVGTMRLIIPGQIFNSPLNNIALDNWIRSISKTLPESMRRKLSAAPYLQALPILAAFKYFEGHDCKIPDDGSISPKNICELSRVIVAPEYRGMGISSLLVNHAIEKASELGRKYLWLECAPHHIGMYEKYGFKTKVCDGARFYERAQQLDTWAVAMYLNTWNRERPNSRLVSYG